MGCLPVKVGMRLLALTFSQTFCLCFSCSPSCPFTPPFVWPDGTPAPSAADHFRLHLVLSTAPQDNLFSLSCLVLYWFDTHHKKIHGDEFVFPRNLLRLVRRFKVLLPECSVWVFITRVEMCVVTALQPPSDLLLTSLNKCLKRPRSHTTCWWGRRRDYTHLALRWQQSSSVSLKTKSECAVRENLANYLL